MVQRFTSGNQPQTNGLTERMNRTINNMLANIVSKNRHDCYEWLPTLVWSYNTPKHSATGYTPFELNHEIAATLLLDAKLTDQAEKQPASEWVKTLRKQINFLQEQNLMHQQAAAGKTVQHKEEDTGADEQGRQPGETTPAQRSEDEAHQHMDRTVHSG